MVLVKETTEKEVDISEIFPIETVMYLHSNKGQIIGNVEELLEEMGIKYDDMPKEFKDNIPYALYEVGLKVRIDKKGNCEIIGLS